MLETTIIMFWTHHMNTQSPEKVQKCQTRWKEKRGSSIYVMVKKMVKNWHWLHGTSSINVSCKFHILLNLNWMRKHSNHEERKKSFTYLPSRYLMFDFYICLRFCKNLMLWQCLETNPRIPNQYDTSGKYAFCQFVVQTQMHQLLERVTVGNQHACYL